MSTLSQTMRKPNTSTISASDALFAAHLLVDAVEVLLATFDAARDAGLLERCLDVLQDLADELLLVAPRLLERLLDDPVPARVQRLEAELLEFALDGIDAEAIGDGREDLERLAGDGASPGRRHGAERSHVVRAVRELDHDDPDIPDHREQHLAEAFGLRLRTAAELDLVELGDAIDQVRNLSAELLGDFGLGRRRVFNDVVQDGRDDGLGVEVQVCQADRRRRPGARCRVRRKGASAPRVPARRIRRLRGPGRPAPAAGRSQAC